MSKDYDELEFAINILIDRFLPGKWKIRESGSQAIVEPSGWIKKPRARMAHEKFNENGLTAVLDLDVSPPRLTVWDNGLAGAIASDSNKPAARPDWASRRAA
jgi:hypothetical protein